MTAYMREGKVFHSRNSRVLLLLLLLLTTVSSNTLGQKVQDGVYYIKNNVTTNGPWYLWPAETKSSSTGNRFLTTFNDTIAPAIVNLYAAHDELWSHWVVKNVTDNGENKIQLINPKLNQCIAIRKWPKDVVDNDKDPNAYGDRDIWLTDVPTGKTYDNARDSVDYTYFVLNNNNSPYKISPNPGINGVTNNTLTFNSPGEDRAYLVVSYTSNTNEGRKGMIQLYDNNPLWSFTRDLMPAPSINYSPSTASVTFSYNIASGYDVLYTTDGSAPTIGGTGVTTWDGHPIQISGHTTMKAVVVRYGLVLTEVATREITYDTYVISSASDLANISNHLSSNCLLNSDINASGLSLSISGFSGVLEGNNHTISGLSEPLFSSINDGTVCNLTLSGVDISSHQGNTGAICCEATGDTRIYNIGILSGSVGGTGNTGGLVGLLDGNSRVINCFSYADITGGTDVGGIVGHNNFPSTSADIRTMVMNCMYYGDISGGSSKAPIYNGEIITNVGKDIGLSNYNYFLAEARYAQQNEINKYNCALMAEKRFLQRFEFFRHLLNSNRGLAAWYVTGSMDDKDQMKKWVMEPSQIGSDTPYPILKVPGKYHSVVNIDAEHATTQAERNQGGLLGTLTVNIQMGDGAVYNRPASARITTSQLTLNITDKDTLHHNFNYYKVQLPYYNDVGTNNYTGNRVVTGWKITSITGGTAGSFTTGDDATFDKDNGTVSSMPYNFADRNCTNKDLYSQNGGVIFNQGAYFDVPEGVTAITIQPYWAKCVYLADSYVDRVYNTEMETISNVTTVGGGQRYSNKSSYSINGSTQVVYTVYSGTDSAVNNLFNLISEDESKTHSVYDYAVVLLSNFHWTGALATATRPFTLMSADLDFDNEPDANLLWRVNGRTKFHPVRYDFINLIGLGMAKKSTGSRGSYNIGIPQPSGWFEMTNTALFRVTQFEFDRSDKVALSPIILQGGVIEQWVSGQNNGVSGNINYFHVGGNVWFKEFHLGCHQDKDNLATKHSPVSVTGGDFDNFYLTGLYAAATNNRNDNAECYINGGRFGIMAGTGMEGLGHATNHTNGNIFWQIDHADITEFYGGGINAANPAQGSIRTIISNSHVGQFCGGPKFGDMQSGMTVRTTAEGCTFGNYFGAGYGGNSYMRRAPKNQNEVININWNSWVNTEYTQTYYGSYGGVSTQIDYQFIPMSDNKTNVARLWVEYVKFSLATTHEVTNDLTGCDVTGSFYGGGRLGKVSGTVTSTLDNCTVGENVYGAGYSAALPTVEVMNLGGFHTEPFYNESTGVFQPAVFPTTTTYRWEYKDDVNSTETAINTQTHVLYTTENLNTLGTVEGKVTLTIKGNNTAITGDVYGGGESSNATDATEVNVLGGSMTDVYGGGKVANVGGATMVSLKGGTVNGNVYGGGRGTTDEKDGEGNVTTAGIAATVGAATVELNNGVGDTEKGCVVSGNIFGCNNLNGTPLGDVTVHVYGTQKAEASQIKNSTEVPDAKVTGSYDVKAVYGGGNLAEYAPTNSLLADNATNQAAIDAAHTNVIIEGCGRTSIYQVYGGGNAASTPGTSVIVRGTFEIEEVFGGGNGKDSISYDGGVTKLANPGANVGYHQYADDAADAATPELRRANYKYGSGRTQVNINGGTIHRVYGGSNTKGNVRHASISLLEDLNECAFVVDEAYGGGKSASMDGTARLEMKCIPGLTRAYGGAENADIFNNVELNITNGRFAQVFGGNNQGGRIMGKITVNIEETGCRPIVIGELYGGGNRAPYSIYGYKEVQETVTETDGQGNEVERTVTVWRARTSAQDSGTGPATPFDDPVVNVKSFASIAEVYGGGYGETAVMVGSPTVNVNVVAGDHSSSSYDASPFIIDGKTIQVPSRDSGAIGAIYNIFGGGNAAEVVGDTHVNVGTKATVDYVTTSQNEQSVRTGLQPVGADIRGSVHGGGNAARVTGDTYVQIGEKQNVTPSPSPAP